MANSYRTIEPCTLGEIIEAARDDGFSVTDELLSDGRIVGCGLVHDDGRGCYGMCEEDGDDGCAYVGCMNDPKVPGYGMQPDADAGFVDDDEEEDDEGAEDSETGTMWILTRAGRPHGQHK